MNILRKITSAATFTIFCLAATLGVFHTAPNAWAAQGCALNSFYGTVTYNGIPTDGANVALTDTNGSQALTATTTAGGLYLIETANFNTCASAGDQIMLTATFNGSSISTTTQYVTQAATQVNLSITDTGTVPTSTPTTTPVLTSISVTPPSSSIAVGATQQFTATALDQNNVPLITQPVFTWSSDSSTIASVSSTGIANALSVGTALITASDGGLNGTSSLMITAPPTTPTSTPITTSTPPIPPINDHGNTDGGGGGGGNNGRGGGNPVHNRFNIPHDGISLQINDGRDTTNDRNVTLHLFGGNDAKKMAISNSPDFNGISQEPFSTSKNWTLPNDPGRNTVYVEYFNQLGETSPVVSSSITINNSNKNTKNTYPDRSILRGPNNKLYVVMNGKIRAIKNVKSLGKSFAKSKIYNVSSVTLSNYPKKA